MHTYNISVGNSQWKSSGKYVEGSSHGVILRHYLGICLEGLLLLVRVTSLAKKKG
jgi:hypothetical protein